MAPDQQNYRSDSLMLGFSDLKRLRSERPLVPTSGCGITVFDETKTLDQVLASMPA